jgi:calcium binding protein 39
MPSFWTDLCCCFSSNKKDFDGSFYHNRSGVTENEANNFGNSFTQGNTMTIQSINSATGGASQNGASGSLLLLSSFYRTRPKSPRDLIKSIKGLLSRYEATPTGKDESKNLSKISQEMEKPISALKALTLQSEEDVLKGDYDLQMFLIKEIYESDLFEILIKEIEKFPFESRKDAVIIFNSLLRRQIPANRQIVAENLRDNRRELLKDLLDGYDKPERTLHYGLMLRECIKFEFLAEIILNLPEFEKLFDYIQLPTFDVSSDAFATFKDLLTRHKNLVTIFLVNSYEMVFGRLNGLLTSENYVTRRQSLKLLGEILHDRRNYEVMLKYVSEVENLKLLMGQLRDKSEKIQFEAFQVFKIFIANPNKPKPIYDILCKNRDKILHFLENFSVLQGGKQMDDRNFNEDKLFLIEKLQLLPQYTKPQKAIEAIEKLTVPTTTTATTATTATTTTDIEPTSIQLSSSELCDQNETESLVLSRSASVLSASVSMISELQQD